VRVLYIASQSPKEETLLIEHEITKLQRQLRAKTGAEIDLKFLPAVPFQDIRNQVEDLKPDVLHISAHGNANGVHLTDSHGSTVTLNSQSLPAAIGAMFRPRLLYLSACNSAPVAAQLKNEIPLVIGTTDQIANYYAREASTAFYECLFSGYTVEDAFKVSKSLLETLSGGVSTDLFAKLETDRRAILFQPPRLVARFKPNYNQRRGHFSFEPGFRGAPVHTTQVVFFTDDTTFLDSEEPSMEENLCWVCRDKAYDGIRWLDDYWQCDGDFDLYATAVTQEGKHTTVHAKVKDALTEFYKAEAIKTGNLTPNPILDAIQSM
jgi:hypothetical protein